jgi:uncharacterized repeat protein (TIGR03803 family)
MRVASSVPASAIVAALVLCGCGASSSPPVSGAFTAAAPRHATSSSHYAVIAKFTDYATGSRPDGAMIDVDGRFYGVTKGGGLKGCGNGSKGQFCGTVFSVTPDGVKRVVYKFKGGSDGGRPVGRLVNVDGTLYGTTTIGGSGSKGYGTVFSLTTNGTETVLYRFAGGSDGAAPEGGLVNLNGVLYGTTEYGGGSSECRNSRPGCGTVFSVTTSGTERVLHRFSEKSGDGITPFAGLIDVGGTLYGTTFAGGREGNGGTVYSITPSGKEKTIYWFNGPAGFSPFAELTNVDGTLYGTTAGGGAHHSGTVYSVTMAGVAKLVYSFPGSGAVLFGRGNPVTYLGGLLYVATPLTGILYSITLKGTGTELYRFIGGPTGCVPSSGLLAVNGALYGATALGGEQKRGCHGSALPGGVLYRWTP